MTSGRAALHRLDRSIADARRTLSDASNAAAVDARALAEIDTRQVDVYRRLADIRLDLIREDDTGESLGAADREAERLIAKHDGALATFAERRDAAEAEIERLERDRRAQEDALEEATAAHDAAAERTHARLEQDADYQARAAAVDEADAIAARAAQKLEVARETRAEKGAAYEQDALFSYLWKRKFATKDYRAFPLFAVLDRWVAGIIKYRNAQLNYRRLLELPERFGEHADRVNEAAEKAAAALEMFERDALEKDGVGALRDAVKAARDKLDTLDQQLAETEARHETLVAEHAEAAAGRKGPLEDARMVVAKALSKRSVPDLKILAAETIERDDDRLVDEIISLKRERMELEESRSAVRHALDRHKHVLSELEDIRRRFKRAKYDSPYSEFSGRDLVGSLVGELLAGTLGADDFWRRLRRAQHTRKRDWDDDFSGIGGREWRGGFGLPDNWGETWTGGREWGRTTKRRTTRPVRIPRAPRMPRSPRPPRIRFPRTRGGGGFKTGGGF
ncbi:MAG: hypothetical protein AAGJ73_00775 [Pseudomonadota bacterium]